jgi:hypothetical protein
MRDHDDRPRELDAETLRQVSGGVVKHLVGAANWFLNGAAKAFGSGVPPALTAHETLLELQGKPMNFIGPLSEDH